MSEQATSNVDRTELRKTIRDTVRQADSAPPRASLVTSVVANHTIAEQTVQDELDTLEQHGFIYLVGDDERVKLP